MAEDFNFLTQVPLFSRLDREELQSLIKRMHSHTFSSGEEIIKEGDQDRRLFVIVRGSVKVIKSRGQHNERHFATLGPRDYFGEMALMDDLVRSATVVAEEETEVLSLDQWDLHKEIARTPSIATELLKMLSQRIRALEKVVMDSLGGLLPICMHCKNIRDERGSWIRIEDYISDRSEADFTHGICPDCMRKLYPKHFKNEQH